MLVPAISVIANHRHQALLIREGGWGTVPPTFLKATETPSGTSIRAEGEVVGLAQASAMGALAFCMEFHLGEIRMGRIDQVGTVRLVIATTAVQGGQS